jgi:hypothetical protein
MPGLSSGREVGSSVKGNLIRCQEYGHGPTAAPGHHLHGGHIDRIQVRPLFSIDLDIDEVFVHQPGDFFILERLVFHDVAPVARRVADAEQNGFVFFPCSMQRLLAPGIPLDRVVGVLQQVGTGLVGQSVGEFMFRHTCRLCDAGRPVNEE